MPAKHQIYGSAAQPVLLLCMLFLFFGPTTARASTQQLYKPVEPGATVVTASSETNVIVTTSSDLVDGDTSSLGALNSHPGADGAISLREAVLAANTTTNTAALTIAFDIPTDDPGYDSANTTWTIAVGAQPSPDPTSGKALPTLTHGNLTIDGTTQPGDPDHPRIVLDGYNVYEAAGMSNGFTITSDQNTIRGLTLISFYDDAVLISGPDAAYNHIAGCYLGLTADGAIAAQPSYFGVELRDGAHDNVVGGGNTAARNLLSGNVHSGVLIQGATTRNNTVAGNWIGSDPSGQAPLNNGVAGIMVSAGAHDNLVGGAYQGNLISGNDTGIYIDGGVATTVAGNTIGLAADGHTQLGNINSGILMVRGAHDNIIGGVNFALRNVISGNGSSASAFGQGIYLSDTNTVNNTIQGNYIGVDADGNLPIGNYRQGVLIGSGAESNRIGGTTEGAGNVIAYNGLGGIRIDSPANQIAGNLIGVGADGSTQLGNQLNGVRVVGDDNTIGPSNLIAYNQHSGILLSGSATMVLSNTLMSNARSGICVMGPNSTIRGNLIDSNGGGDGPWPECAIRGGVVITGTNGTLVTDNNILSNDDAGVTVYNGVSNRILSNSISGNGAAGIQLERGGNNEIAPPHLDSVTTKTVRGAACPLCRVELFTDTGDEGLTLVGTTTAANDGSFDQVIAPAPPGTNLTATHTDSNGNTSSFTPAVSVPPDDGGSPSPPPAPTPSPTPRPSRPYQFIPLISI
jgi:hypothetical protein